MDLFSQILNQSKLGTPWQFSGGSSFGSINTQDFQSKLPTIQKGIQAEQNLINQGFSEKEVKFLKLQKEKWVDMNQAFAFIEKKRQEEKWFWDTRNREWFTQNALGVLADFAWGVVSEAPKFAWETASFLSNVSQYNPFNLVGTAIGAVLNPNETYGSLREKQKASAENLATIGQKWKELVQNTGLYDPTTTSAKAGELWTQIAGSIVWPNKVGVLKKWAEIVWAGKKLATTAKIGDIALEWGLAGAKFGIGSEWRIDPTEVALWAIGNVGIAGALKWVGRAYESITWRLPASLTLWGLINPWKLDVVKKTLQVDEWVATPEDVGKWILDRVKPWNKQEIADQLIQHAEKTKWAVDESLASIPTYFKNTEAKKALMQIRNDLEWKTWLEDKILKIDELLAKPDYTLSELNAVKRELDDMYNLYTKSTDPTAWLKAQWLRNVRANIRKFIEDEAEKYGVNIRKLNNETAVARGLADWILRKDSADWVRELLTAFAPSGAWAAIWAWQAIARWEDPLTVLRDALIGGIATKIGTSTAVRTRIASSLNRLAPKELTALENYIRSGGKDAIGKKVAEKVIKEGRALPARTLTKEVDFAKPTQKAIITPQTQERAIIEQSKKGLSPNVKRPNGNNNNSSSNTRNIPVWSKKVQKASPQVTPTPKKEVVKPVEYKFQSIITPILSKNGTQAEIAKWVKFLSNTNNKEWRKIFEETTWISLPKTQKESTKVIEEYIWISWKKPLSIKTENQWWNNVYYVIDENGNKISDMFKWKMNAEKEMKKMQNAEYWKPSQPPPTLSTKGTMERKALKQSPDKYSTSLIKSVEWINDFVSYFHPKLWNNITKSSLKKLWFTDKQLDDVSYSFLVTKDNPYWISLEDLFHNLKNSINK